MEQSLIVRQSAQDALPTITPENMQKALSIGDISQLDDQAKVQFYVATCESMGLNPMTAPFDLLKADDGKMRLYPNMRAAEQLRMKYRVSIDKVTREQVGDLFIVTAYASTKDGRKDEAQGIVSLAKARGEWKTSQNGRRYFAEEKDVNGQPIMEMLRGEALANAMKKAESQAKRRATLSICGLGYMSDAPQSDDARIPFNPHTGEVIESGPFLATPAEQAKGVAEHIADLFGDPPSPVAHGIPPGPLAQEINALLSQLGKDTRSIVSWWEDLRRGDRDLTPGFLNACKEKLLVRLARMEEESDPAYTAGAGDETTTDDGPF